MIGVISKSEQKKVLTAYRRSLSQERHNLRERPEILWQQLYNRLQWADGGNKGGPVAKVISTEFEKRTAPDVRPWMHNKCRTRESEALIMVLTGHTGWIRSCTFSPDGKALASASNDNTVRLWDVVTGAEQAVLKGHTNWVTSCAFSPDGQTLASASRDRTVRLWDLGTGTERAVLEGHTNEVYSCAFNPDAKTLASASWDKTLRLWDVPTSKLISMFPCIGDVCICSFSPSGNMIAAGDRGGNIYILSMYGFDLRHPDIISKADILTEHDPEQFPAKTKSQKEQEDMQQVSAGSNCRCGKINPPHSKWCKKCGWEV